ncbi:hypothetical protein CYY_003747 [Polysphondylium violaceum]|uniref:Uncharacterized protein n=1 Tax=Polysphondylium violaceum TaxID=133409 RepID=A0A8J4PWD3_9MYCE|nr:hypothetical protein CYY_003747 [Polysphondylium violaceum]
MDKKVLETENQYLRKRVELLINENKSLTELLLNMESTCCLFRHYPMIIKDLEDKLSNSQNDYEHIFQEFEKHKKEMESRIKYFEEVESRLSQTNLDNINKMKNSMDLLKNEFASNSNDLTNQINQLALEKQELSNLIKKNNEKEIYQKSLLEKKIQEIKDMKNNYEDKIKSITDEQRSLTLKNKDLENQLELSFKQCEMLKKNYAKIKVQYDEQQQQQQHLIQKSHQPSYNSNNRDTNSNSASRKFLVPSILPSTSR